MANCVRCGKELPSVTTGDLKDTCVECQVRERIAREQEARANRPTIWQMAQMFPATSTIFAICVLIYLGCAAQSLKTGVGSPMEFDARMLLPWGADFGPLTLTGQWWRILTSIFVHGGLIHIGANMWCFWDLGRITERVYGRWRFVVLFLLTGLASSVTSLAIHPAEISVGASGAIFGAVGALIFPFYRKRVVLPPPVLKSMLRSFVVFIIINLMIGAAVPMIDNAAHVGGLLAGLLLGAVITQLSISGRSVESYFPKVAAVTAIAIGFGFVAVQHWRGTAILADLSYLELERGNTNAAFERAKHAVAKDPKNALAHMALGEVYWQKGQIPDAAKEFQRAHELEPKDAAIAGELGSAYLAIGKMQEAEPLLRQAIQEDPKDAVSLQNLGIVLAAENRPDEAAQYLRQALAANPKSAKANYALGSVLVDQQRYREALAPLGNAVQLDPNNKDYRRTLERVTVEANAQAGESK